jgi:callose synthase
MQQKRANRLHNILKVHTFRDEADGKQKTYNTESIPKNLEARRRLEFFTNSLFMNMPKAKPVSKMFSFWLVLAYYGCLLSAPNFLLKLHHNTVYTQSLTVCCGDLCSVFTPYYTEDVMYDLKKKKKKGGEEVEKSKKDEIKELDRENEDGITILFYLQKIYPGKVMTYEILSPIDYKRLVTLLF